MATTRPIDPWATIPTSDDQDRDTIATINQVVTSNRAARQLLCRLRAANRK